MKHVQEPVFFTTDDFSAQEIITEIGDCLTILKANLSSDDIDIKQALDRANEIENILLVALGKKIDKMLPFVPVEIQEKEKL